MAKRISKSSQTKDERFTTIEKWTGLIAGSGIIGGIFWFAFTYSDFKHLQSNFDKYEQDSKKTIKELKNEISASNRKITALELKLEGVSVRLDYKVESKKAITRSFKPNPLQSVQDIKFSDMGINLKEKND